MGGHLMQLAELTKEGFQGILPLITTLVPGIE